MKKINKYIMDAQIPSLREELKQYKKISEIFRKSSGKNSARKISPLSMIIPFAAASLSPFAINAQCGTAIINITGEGTGNELISIDIDGDTNVDFELDANPTGVPDLFLETFGGAEVVAADVGGFFYPTLFNSGDAITSSNPNWVSTSTATLAFNGNGDWSGGGIVTGFLAVRINSNQLGFIQVAWNNATSDITVDAGTMGVESDGAIATSVNAGDCMALPVELINFEGKMFDSHAELNWSTGSETDNKGFEIQRSKNGKIFKTVGFVEGQGYSDVRIDYSFNDESIREGTDYYYRLKQMDFWGRSEASEVINLKAATPAAITLKVSPNPAGEFINVDYQSQGNTSAELSIFNSNGQQLINQTLDSDSKANFQLNIEQLPAGSYFLKVEEAGEVKYRKFIKA